MAHRLSDESRARVAKSSAGRSRRPRNRVYPRQGTSASDTPEPTSDAASSTSDPSPTTPTTTPPSSTPSPTSPSTSDAVSTTPSSSSGSPATPSTSSSRFTTSTPPPSVSSSSSSDGSITSITTPASSSRSVFSPSETTPISTDPVSTPPASTTPGPSSSAAESSSNPPSSETQTVSSPATTTTPPPVSTSARESTTLIESDTTVPVSSRTNRVVTSDSVIFSSASDIQVSVTTTNSLGQTTIGIPPVFTTTYTSTSNGIPLTITAVVSQATTLNTDGGGSASPFFKNKGAVAGVFIVVGIAGAAIILFGIFTYLRRRKVRRLTREAAIAATLGSGRTPFVDDDDADAYGSGPSGGNSTEMGYHSASDTRPVYGSYPAAYGAGSASYGYGPDPFYGNPPAGNSFNASPPGSIDHHGPALTNPQVLLPPASTSYGGAPGGPNLPPTTPLLAKGNQTTAPAAAAPASPPNVYTNANVSKGYEYDYSNYVPPSAVDGGAGRGLSPSPTSPTSPTFSKRSSLPLPPPGAAAPSYTALAAAAGLVSDPSGPPTTNIPPSAYQGTASNKARRTSNTPSFASSASRYSVDTPGGDAVAGQSQTLALPTYSAANVSKSQSGHSFNASSSNQSHGRPPTPGAEVFLGGDRGGLVRSASGGSDWRAGGRPETPLIDHRLDPDTVLAAKGRSPGNRLSDYSTPSEESLGSLQDHEDYSRRVLQVTNPS